MLYTKFLETRVYNSSPLQRTAIGKTPFSLVYGIEAVLPIEIEIKSLRVIMEAKTPESEWERKRYDHLVSLDEKRMDALFTLRFTREG